MTKHRASLIFFAATVFLLSGCDRLSKIDNESQQKLTVRYWHTDYNRWSPKMASDPNQTIHIPPGHHFTDVSCLEIVEGSKRFVYDNAALRGVQTLCRKTNSCTIVYLGGGRMRVNSGNGASDDPNHPLPKDKNCRT